MIERLPTGETASVEVEAPGDLQRRAAADALAPTDEPTLGRYLVYLGAAYLEAELLLAEPEAFARLHRFYGGVGGEAAVLRFHYAESARGYAEEKRARAAHERMAGAYGSLIEKMEAEITTREERIRNLQAALER